MKHTLLALFLLLGCSVLAQDLSFTPNKTVKAGDVRLDDLFEFVKAEAQITNSGSTVSVKWTVRQVSGPSEWSFAFCDENACYPYGTESNVNDNINEPLVLESGTGSNMDIQVRHGGVAGTGVFEVTVAATDEPNEVLATTTYELTMNQVVSTREEEPTYTFKVYPNPAQDYFSVFTEANIHNVSLYNVVGRQVRNYPGNIYNRYQLNGLPDGIYLIRLKDDKGMTLRTQRLVKRVARP